MIPTPSAHSPPPPLPPPPHPLCSLTSSLTHTLPSPSPPPLPHSPPSPQSEEDQASLYRDLQEREEGGRRRLEQLQLHMDTAMTEKTTKVTPWLPSSWLLSCVLLAGFCCLFTCIYCLFTCNVLLCSWRSCCPSVRGYRVPSPPSQVRRMF